MAGPMAARKVQNLCCIRGRYRRTLGKFVNTRGKVTPKKFLLGMDRDQAERANLRLEQLWRDVERLWHDDSTSRADGKHPIWDPLTLHMAEAIRQGQRIQITEEMLKDRKLLSHTQQAIAQWVWWIRKTYTSVADLIDQPESAIFQESRAHAEGHAKLLASLSAHLAEVADTPAAGAAPGQTLHLALEAWGEHIRNLKTDGDGELIESGRKIIEASSRFRENHTDLPLALLNYKAVSEIVGFWRSRPPSKANNKTRGKRISVTTVKNHLGYFRRFLAWLHRSDDFEWRDNDRIIEDALGRQQTAPLLTAEEVKKAAKGPTSWKVEELTTLYAAATHRERLYMLLGLNAGYAQSEIRHLMTEEIYFDRDPPDMWCTRRKTGKPSAVTVWPETIEALKWATSTVKRSKAAATPWAVTTQNGTPLSRQEISNSWNRLLDRVQQQDPKFRRLPFKYLRKTNASLLQQCGADSEIIAIVQGRAKRSHHDDQADVYYPRMVSKVEPAMSKFRELLQPMFNSTNQRFGCRQSFPKRRRNKQTDCEKTDQQESSETKAA